MPAALFGGRERAVKLFILSARAGDEVDQTNKKQWRRDYNDNDASLPVAYC